MYKGEVIGNLCFFFWYNISGIQIIELKYNIKSRTKLKKLSKLNFIFITHKKIE